MSRAEERWRPVEERWSAGGAGTRYAEERWRSSRARGRDPRLVERLLRSIELPRDARVLDVPCGDGRLTAGLSRFGRPHGVDVSTEMLAAARARPGGSEPLPVMLGDAAHLPFRAETFELVVCCRLLHHLTADAALERVAAELVRVSRRFVAASFWDSASWHAWRRRAGLRRTGPRSAVSKQRVARAFEDAGASVRGYAHSFRFVSPQVFVLAEKR